MTQIAQLVFQVDGFKSSDIRDDLLKIVDLVIDDHPRLRRNSRGDRNQLALAMKKDGLCLVDDHLMGAIEGFLVTGQLAARSVHNKAVQLSKPLETVGEPLLRMDDNILLKSGNGSFEGMVVVKDELRRFGRRFGGQMCP